MTNRGSSTRENIAAANPQSLRQSLLIEYETKWSQRTLLLWRSALYGEIGTVSPVELPLRKLPARDWRAGGGVDLSEAFRLSIRPGDAGPLQNRHGSVANFLRALRNVFDV